MSEEEKKEIKELIMLLYYNQLSQYGKRKLETYINKLQKELDKKNICLKACEDNLIKERQLRIKQDKVINLMAEVIEECRENGAIEFNENIDLSEIAGENRIIEYFYKKVEEEKWI